MSSQERELSAVIGHDRGNSMNTASLPLLDKSSLLTSTENGADDDEDWYDDEINDICGLLSPEECRLMMVTMDELIWLTGADDEIKAEEDADRSLRIRRSPKLISVDKLKKAMKKPKVLQLLKQKMKPKKSNYFIQRNSRWGRSVLDKEDSVAQADDVESSDGNEERSRSKRAALPKKHIMWTRVDPSLREELKKYSALRKNKGYVRQHNRWG